MLVMSMMMGMTLMMTMGDYRSLITASNSSLLNIWNNLSGVTVAICKNKIK
jgi:hypothetical protein